MSKQFLILSLLSLAIFLLPAQAFPQKEQRDRYKRPHDFLVPSVNSPFMSTEEYRDAHEELERDFWWLYEQKEKDQILNQNREAVLKTITSDKDFWKIAKARYWCAKNLNDVIPSLIELIRNSKMVGLTGYADLIIWERIESKDLPFYGHGWVVPDDLFSVAGRASWLLRETTGQNFEPVSMKSTPEQLNQLSEAWRKWYERNR